MKGGGEVLYTGCSRLRRALAELQIRLQDQHRGHLIDDFGPALNAHLRLSQHTVRLHRRQPLVEEMHRQLEPASQLVGEGPNLFRLNAFLAAHAQRESDDNLGHAMLPNQSPEVIEVGLLVAAAIGRQSLRRKPEPVAYGKANFPRAIVDGENSAFGAWRGTLHFEHSQSTMPRIVSLRVPAPRRPWLARWVGVP